MIVYFVQTHAGIKKTMEFKDTCQLPVKKCHHFFFLNIQSKSKNILYGPFIFSTEIVCSNPVHFDWFYELSSYIKLFNLFHEHIGCYVYSECIYIYYNFTSDACMEYEISKDSFQLDDIQG